MLEYLLIVKLKLAGLSSTIPASWLQGSKNPVVVIPGFHETFWFLKKLVVFFNFRGYPIHIISPFISTDTVFNLSMLVGDYIKNNNLNDVILLTHSKGGVISKHMICNNPDINSRVSKVIAVATPFNGTLLGYLHFDNAHELKPTNSVITQLQSNTSVNKKFISLYPLVDNHILPNNSSILQGAENIQIPVIGHTIILESDKTLEVLSRYFKVLQKVPTSSRMIHQLA